MESAGIQEIAFERAEQIIKHGQTVESDVKFNTRHQLTYAATMLLLFDYHKTGLSADIDKYALEYLPPSWDLDLWKKMLSKSFPERVKIAGALCAAELDRILFTGDTSEPIWVSTDNQSAF